MIIDFPTRIHSLEESVARPLEDGVVLLHLAALAAWALADSDGLASPMHHLGVGLYLAHNHAATLLPVGHELDAACAPTLDPPAQTDPGALLRSAETRLRAIPADALIGFADVLLEVGDLVRECRQHGW